MNEHQSHTPRKSADARRLRQVAIAEHVIKRGIVTVEDLCDLTGVSQMTVYRDIASLEEAGLIQRHRGRVSAVASGLHEAGAAFRMEQNPDLKEDLGQEVASLILPGSSIAIDDSTSSVWLLRALADRTPLTVITNSLLVAGEVAESQTNMRLFLTGGEYQPWAQAFTGPTTISSLSGIRSDYCIISASGIQDGLCFHPYEDVVEVKKAMIASARMSILLLDHTKFSRRALHSFARLDEIDLVVFDAGTPDDVVAEMDKIGVKYRIAGQGVNN